MNKSISGEISVENFDDEISEARDVIIGPGCLDSTGAIYAEKGFTSISGS